VGTINGLRILENFGLLIASILIARSDNGSFSVEEYIARQASRKELLAPRPGPFPLINTPAVEPAVLSVTSPGGVSPMTASKQPVPARWPSRSSSSSPLPSRRALRRTPSRSVMRTRSTNTWSRCGTV